MIDVAVIGGGAAGLMAAIACAEAGGAPVILERNDRVGKKLLSTGNGRCNFTNTNLSIGNFHGEAPNFAAFALQQFNQQNAIEFFSKLGILVKIEPGGKVYPYSLQASSVLDVLRGHITTLGVPVKHGFLTRGVQKVKNGFRIESSEGETVHARKVIVATGGMAGPATGSDGSGFTLLKSLGHEVSTLSPALVHLKTESRLPNSLKGIKFFGTATAAVGDKVLKTELGEILFTETGLSGLPIFQLSIFLHSYKNLIINLDFMPEHDESALSAMLFKRRENLAHLTAENFLNGLINKKVGQAITKLAGVEKLSLAVSNIPDKTLNKIATLIKKLPFEISGTTGFKFAQVTAGGAKTHQFDERTMQSKLVDGLFASGEVLDICGDCGGYNLQWAWASGYVAGKNAATKEAAAN